MKYHNNQSLHTQLNLHLLTVTPVFTIFSSFSPKHITEQKL